MIIILNILRFFFFLLFLLPAEAALFLMYTSADLVYKIVSFTSLKKKIAGNISLFFPQAQADQLAGKLLRNVCYGIFEIICFPFFREKHIKRIVLCQNLENLDRGVAQRKGVILLAMHTGNYELIPIFLFQKGYKINSIVKAPPTPLFHFLNQSRRYRGIKLINVLETNMYREALKALQAEEIVGLMIDTGALESHHEMFNFLGKNVPVATGWLTLAQRSQAAVVPVYSQRRGRKVFINFGEPLSVTSNNRDEVMLKLRNFFENFIKNHPEEWGIFLNDYEVKRMVEGG